ncbi:MAG TPA: hypothetical protein VFU31_21325 [Candidatus Binatia bacterium]|nr:hypothetical protein [Candidatus Binatia bacterium]
MAIGSLARNQPSASPTKVVYSKILRCIGQTVEAMDLKALEVRTQGETYVVQIWNKGTSITMNLEKHYTLEDIKKLEAEGRQTRKPLSGPPNLLILSQVLRLAGNYVDRSGGRLIRVSWQEQADRIQSVTIQYGLSYTDHNELPEPQTIEELCIHLYKQKKKIAAGTDKSVHRSFVSVAAGK